MEVRKKGVDMRITKEFLEDIKNDVRTIKEQHLMDGSGDMVIICDKIISFLEDDRLLTNPSSLDRINILRTRNHVNSIINMEKD